MEIQFCLRPLLTYGIDCHGLLQLNRIRVSGFARVFPGLLLLQRVEEQGQDFTLVHLGVHRGLRMGRIRAVWKRLKKSLLQTVRSALRVAHPFQR